MVAKSQLEELKERLESKHGHTPRGTRRRPAKRQFVLTRIETVVPEHAHDPHPEAYLAEAARREIDRMIREANGVGRGQRVTMGTKGADRRHGQKK